MSNAIRSLTASVMVWAIAAPSFASPRLEGGASGKPAIEVARQSALERETASIDRQQKMWNHLSASICNGCITAANRVAPFNYDRPSINQLAAMKTEPQPVRVKTAQRLTATPRKFASLRKHYAKLHRRERMRLAARSRALKAAALAKRHHIAKLAFNPAKKVAPARAAAIPVRATVAPVGAVFSPSYMTRSETRIYRSPVDQPGLPRDDGRWRETIIPPVARMRRT